MADLPALRQGCGGFGRSVSGGRQAGLYVRTNANQALRVRMRAIIARIGCAGPTGACWWPRAEEESGRPLTDHLARISLGSRPAIRRACHRWEL